MRKWRTRPLLVLAAIVAGGSPARAQLGSALSEIENRYGKGQSVLALDPIRDARRYVSDGRRELTIGFENDKARYALLENSFLGGFDNAGTLRFVEEASPPAPDAKLMRWSYDPAQTGLYPPIGKLLSRSRFIPQAIQLGVTGSQGIERIDAFLVYSDGFRQYLGSAHRAFDRRSIQPFVTGVKTNYLAGRGAARLVCMREDQQTYASMELTFDAERPQAAIDTVLVADAQTHWRMLFHTYAKNVKRPPRGYVAWDSKAEPVPYEDALCYLVAREALPAVYKSWLIDLVLLAVDRNQLPAGSLAEVLDSLDPAELANRAVARSGRITPEVQKRRVRLLGELPARTAVPLLLARLTSKSLQDDAAAALGKIAARLGQDQRAIDELGTDPAQWRRWWQQARAR
jgi:hypothetical protein